MGKHPYHNDADELEALRRLYPALSDQELREVQEKLDRYVDLVARITERIVSDPEPYEQLRKLLDEERKSLEG